jgi:plasmid stabilization system protein ParE
MRLAVEESEFIECDILAVRRYLSRRNPAVAAAFIQSFVSTVELLSNHPEAGRLRADLGSPSTRSWRVKGFRNYLIFYEVQNDWLRLLRVLHGYRDLQAELTD